MFPPERIVCLTEETVETLYLLGEDHRIVGVSGYAVRPSRVRKEKPRVSAFISADIPKILALEPDLVLTFSDLTLNLATREVRRGGRAIELTRTEFTLLEMFLRRPRRVLDRSFILEEVWGYDFPTTANSLEVYVGYLRRKTEAEGESRLIQTVRGVGYVLKES